MTTSLASNSRFKVVSLILLGVVMAAVFLAIQLLDRINKSDSSTQTSLAIKSTLVHDATGGSDVQDDIEEHAVKVADLDEARKMLPYSFPVTSDANGHALMGIYVEDNSILYLRYAGDLYVVYHETPPGFQPNLDEVLNARPDISSVTIRGQQGIASEPGAKITPNDNPRQGGTIGWYEKGLHIAIYCSHGERVQELSKIAESMK